MDMHAFSGKKICVAVSGGVDSVTLLHCLENRAKSVGFTLCAVHCEHGIRGEESREDMRFVQELCARMGLELFLFSEDCLARAEREKQSLETAARNFRYESFSSLVAEGKADFIATAHHKNDEAETVLFRIARGASLTGARGMQEQNGWLIRPFLSWTRAEIENYAWEHELEFRVDSTNADTEFTRNRLRTEILPRLEDAVAGAIDNISRFAARAAEDDELLYEYAQALLTERMGEDGKEFVVTFSEKKPLFRRACLTALKGLGLEKDYTAVHLESAFDLQKKERGARCILPKGLEAVKAENGILFRRERKDIRCKLPESQPFTKDGFDGGRYEVILSQEPLKEDGTWRVLRADGDKIPFSAVFRFRAEGDEILQFGGGTKSLKKFFNERKIPVEERAYLPLIAEQNGEEVYAVCGVEISEKIKVDENTKTVLYIGVRRK